MLARDHTMHCSIKSDAQSSNKLESSLQWDRDTEVDACSPLNGAALHALCKACGGAWDFGQGPGGRVGGHGLKLGAPRKGWRPAC